MISPRSQGSLPANPEQRLPVLDALRGGAAVAVSLYHFTANNPALPPDSPIRDFGKFGWLGVEVFFVVSGFIIPWSLHRGRYAIGDFGTFLLRRIIRLDPPYLVSILVTVALGYMSAAHPAYRGVPYHVTAEQLVLHFAFLNTLFGYPWINEVFWTLSIEFQFYLLLGLIYPLLTSARLQVRSSWLVLLATLPFIWPSHHLIFHYLCLFLIGILVFQLKSHRLSTPAYLLLTAAAGIGTGVTLRWDIAAAGVATGLVIAYVNRTNSLLRFFGGISYSLYLLHGPIGGRVINLAERHVQFREHQILVIAFAMAVATLAAWIFNRLVEVPSRASASRLNYRSGPRPMIETASL